MEAMRESRVDRRFDALKRQLDFDSRQSDRRSDRLEADLRDLKTVVVAEARSTQLLIFQLGVAIMLVLLIGFAMIASRL
jgi:hypothetical protein